MEVTPSMPFGWQAQKILEHDLVFKIISYWFEDCNGV